MEQPLPRSPAHLEEALPAARAAGVTPLAAPALSRHHAAAALAGAWSIFFSGQLLSAGVPYYRDILLTMLPLRAYINQRLRAGQWPQWYPYEALGVPLTGQVATTLYHPATLWMLVFDPLTGIKLTLLLAYAFALTGAYRLARALPVSRWASLGAAFAYAFGGYTLGVSSVLHYAMSQGTLPWVLVFGLRLLRRGRGKDCAYLTLTWASIFLAGDAQGFLGCGVLLVALWACQPSRRGLLWGMLTAGLTFLVCCVEYLPARSLAAQALRGVGAPGAALNSHWSMHWLRLPELLIAGYLPSMGRLRVLDALFGNARGPFCLSLFAGSVVLFLAAASFTREARRMRLWAAVALAALALSLGAEGHVLPLAQRLVPILLRFRYPEKYLAFFWLALVPAVALGCEAVRCAPRRAAWAAAGCAGSIGGLGLLTGGVGVAHRVWRMVGAPMQADDPLADLVDSTWANGLLAAALFLGLTAAILAAAQRRPALLAAVPLVLFAELMQANAQHLPLVPRDWLETTPPFAAAMRAAQDPAGPPARLVREMVPFFPASDIDPPEETQLWVRSVRDMLAPDLGGLYQIASMGQSLGGESLRHRKLMGTGTWGPARYAEWLNGCFRVVGLDRTLAATDRELARDPVTSMKLIASACRPRAFFSATQSVSHVDQALALMRRGQQEAVVWEAGPSLAAHAGKLTWQLDAPEHSILDVEVDDDAALIVTNEFYDGWTATIDGVATPLYKAMVVAGGLVVPRGAHRIELRYQTPGLAWGLAASALGLLGVLATALWRPRRAAAP